MSEYKEMYLRLFGAATDAMELIKDGKPFEAYAALAIAQRDTEDIYISAEDAK